MSYKHVKKRKGEENLAQPQWGKPDTDCRPQRRWNLNVGKWGNGWGALSLGPGQACMEAMVRAAGLSPASGLDPQSCLSPASGPFSSSTGGAEPGTQHPAMPGLGTSDVEAGTGASLGDPGSHTKGSGLRDWLQTRFFPHRSKLFNPLHSSCPPGRHATQFENRCINKLTISVSASRSNLRQLSEIHCFPLQAASWQ